MVLVADGDNLSLLAVPCLIPVYRQQKLSAVATTTYKRLELPAVGLPTLRVLMLDGKLTTGLLHIEVVGIGRSSDA